jgi:hypothetical protein
MRCHEIEELLPDYLLNSLDREQLGEVDRHVEQCADCREQIVLWKKLELLPEEQPSPALRRRFEAMLEAYQQGCREREERHLVRRPSPWSSWVATLSLRGALAQAALAVLFLGVGFAGGKYLHLFNSNAHEMASLKQEVSGMSQLLALSLLQQQSASERLEGVTWTLRANRPDPEILSALLHTLRFDTSVDVRLAALDGLKHFNDQPRVRSGLIEALQTQQSPLLQIALIDLLVELRETAALRQLKDFELKHDLEPVVRQRAQWGIRELTRG